MVLDILCDKLGTKNCIKVAGSIRRRTHDEAADSAPSEPVYDPAIHELHHDDAEFGPGVHNLEVERTRAERNKAFVNVIR